MEQPNKPRGYDNRNENISNRNNVTEKLGGQNENSLESLTNNRY